MSYSRKVRAHTILFTEACPLDCRYCQLKLEEDYHTMPEQTYEEIAAKIEQYYNEDLNDDVITQLTFTGGEPFLYWQYIKDIIDKYQTHFIYHFNTSGYCFTEEMLEFLSHYSTYFTLSVDGGEALTNYLRPVQGTLTRTGYFKKLQQIAPTLLYYFPNVVAKVIINNRHVDLTYQTYLDLERLGFRYITFILDFNARPSVAGTKKQIQRIWNEHDTAILKEQLDLIAGEILLGYCNDIKRMEVTNFNNILTFLLQKIDTYSPDNLPCNVFAGRTLETLTNSEDRSCFDGKFASLQEAKAALIQEFEETKGICPIDSNCPAFLYCANYNCPISSYAATHTFFGSDELECILVKLSYFIVLNMMNYMNQNCSESFLYNQYIRSLLTNKGGCT